METVAAMADISVMIALTCLIALRGIDGSGLDGADLLGDFRRGPGGLGGERLDFGGDDREAAAGFACACGLDRGIEREQVGLAGDRLDQPDHLADAGRGAAELGHRLRRPLRLGDGAGRNFG
jgi:hypothetical protein